MFTHAPSPAAAAAALPARVGRVGLALVAYLGVLGVLLAGGLRGLFWGLVTSRKFRSTLLAELAWVFAMGLPLVAVVHVGQGSFLSMQAYYGGTFVDGTGAVVGVGLFRNVAPQMAGLTLAGLLAARIVPDLRRRARDLAAEGDDDSARREIDRLVAARIGAGVIAGVVLSFWGATVGTIVGWQVGKSLMGVSTHSFFTWFWDMLWYRDVIGIFAKGALFGLSAALLACHEGLLGPDEPETATPTAACRAACLAGMAMLLGNSGWFLLVYHAGQAFGPTLLKPPTL